MQITIGIKHSQRELTLETNETIEAVRAKVDEATAAETPLVLSDDKDRQLIVDAESIAYIELDPAKEQRRVGIGLA